MIHAQAHIRVRIQQLYGLTCVNSSRTKMRRDIYKFHAREEIFIGRISLYRCIRYESQSMQSLFLLLDVE